MSLLDQIRIAQRDAGEAVVIADLEKRMGSLRTEVASTIAQPSTITLDRETAQTLHDRLSSGVFYEDYDGDWALVGTLRAALAA